MQGFSFAGRSAIRPLNSLYFSLFLRYFSRLHRTSFSQIPQGLFTELIGLALLFSLFQMFAGCRQAGSRQWDKDPWMLNTPGGVVDLRTGKMREHRADDYMTKMTAVSPGGDRPRWKAFMKQITDGDEELQRYLQRIAGYSLTGDTREQELYFFWGTGNNGKSVFVLVISGILNDYHTASSIETFTASKFDRHPTEIAKLHGARLVTAAETEEGRRWSEARIKELTGGDKISGRFMRQDFFEFYPQFKLLFIGNHMPTLRIVNKAITRRFNRIPFNVTIPDDQVNKNLAAELKAQEGPAILAWQIEGCLEWQKIGMCPPKVVTDATEAYLESQDVLGEWIEECWKNSTSGFISSTEAFASWQTWADARQEWVGSVKSLVARLEDHAPGAFDLTNAAIASGSESTTPSRTTDPTWFTTQIDVCFNDTSSPI
jgi:putative DNA primase/helicase